MYTLTRDMGIRKGLLTEAPSLTMSMVIAEIFYKFHSFTLECLAFLATWFTVSYLVWLVRCAWSAKQDMQT